MGIVSALAIYFIIWWLVFYVILTLGNRDPSSEGDLVGGTDRGAPARHGLKWKVGVTTVAACVVFAIVYAVLNSGLTLADIPLPSPPGLERTR